MGENCYIIETALRSKEFDYLRHEKHGVHQYNANSFSMFEDKKHP